MPAFEKGNKIWEIRSKHGRNRLFETPDLLLEEAIRFFKWCDDHPWMKQEAIKSGKKTGNLVQIPTQRPYTYEGLSIALDCNTHYFRQFKASITKKINEGKATQLDHDFSLVLRLIDDIVFQNQLEGAQVGAFKENITARYIGLADRVQNDIAIGSKPDWMTGEVPAPPQNLE